MKGKKKNSSVLHGIGEVFVKGKRRAGGGLRSQQNHIPLEEGTRESSPCVSFRIWGRGVSGRMSHKGTGQPPTLFRIAFPLSLSLRRDGEKNSLRKPKRTLGGWRLQPRYGAANALPLPQTRQKKKKKKRDAAFLPP